MNYSFNVAYIFRSDHCVCVNNKNNRCWSLSLSLSLRFSDMSDGSGPFWRAHTITHQFAIAPLPWQQCFQGNRRERSGHASRVSNAYAYMTRHQNTHTHTHTHIRHALCSSASCWLASH